MAAKATEGQEAIDKLFKEGGLLLLNETLVSVHKSELAADGQKWKIIDCGIPVVIATKDKKVVICIAEANTGTPRRNFKFEASSRYTALKDHFHVFIHEGSEYGLNFLDVGIAKKVFSAISLLVPSDPPSEGDEVDGGELPEQAERETLLQQLASLNLLPEYMARHEMYISLLKATMKKIPPALPEFEDQYSRMASISSNGEVVQEWDDDV